MDTDNPPQYINAICDGGPINGGSIAFATPHIDGANREATGFVRGATFVILVDDTHHEYVLTDGAVLVDGTLEGALKPFRFWQYAGIPLRAPTDIVDRP